MEIIPKVRRLGFLLIMLGAAILLGILVSRFSTLFVHAAVPDSGYEWTVQTQTGCTFDVDTPDGLQVVEKRDISIFPKFNFPTLANGRTLIARLYDENKNFITQCGGVFSTNDYSCPIVIKDIDKTTKYSIVGFITANAQDRADGKPYIIGACGSTAKKDFIITKLTATTPMQVQISQIDGVKEALSVQNTFAGTPISFKASIRSDFILDECYLKDSAGNLAMTYSREECRNIMTGKSLEISPYKLKNFGVNTFTLFVKNMVGQSAETTFSFSTDLRLPTPRLIKMELPKDTPAPSPVCNSPTPDCLYGPFLVAVGSSFREVPDTSAQTVDRVALVCYPGESSCIGGKTALLLDSNATSCASIPDTDYVSCTLTSDPSGCYVNKILDINALRGKVLTLCGKVLNKAGMIVYTDLLKINFGSTTSTGTTLPGTEVSTPTLDVYEYVVFDTPYSLKVSGFMKVTLTGKGKKYILDNEKVSDKISLRKILADMQIIGVLPFAKVPIGQYSLKLEAKDGTMFELPIQVPPFYFDPYGDINGDGKGFDMTDRVLFLNGIDSGVYSKDTEAPMKNLLQSSFFLRGQSWFKDMIRG